MNRFNESDLVIYEDDVYKVSEILSDICYKINNNNTTIEVHTNDLRPYIQKHIFIDMDGTIADYYDKKGIVGKDVEFYDGFFYDREPVREVIDSIRKNFKYDELYILSASPHDKGKTEKDQWIDKHFPEIKKENRYFIDYPTDDKCDVLERIIRYLKLKKEYVILIDDDHTILRKCDKELLVQTYHPSHIIVMGYDN